MMLRHKHVFAECSKSGKDVTEGALDLEPKDLGFTLMLCDCGQVTEHSELRFLPL